MDIVSLPVVIDKEKIDSRFRIVILATERAKQIINGARPTVPTRYIKATTMAIEELTESQIDYVTGKEARKAVEDAVASRVLKEMDVEAKEVGEDETKKEIEKDLGVYIHETGDITGDIRGSEGKED